MPASAACATLKRPAASSRPRGARAWVGQHKQIERALVEGQTAGEGGRQTRPIWPAINQGRDAGRQSQQRRLAAGTDIQEIESRHSAIRQRRQSRARRGQRGDERERRHHSDSDAYVSSFVRNLLDSVNRPGAFCLRLRVLAQTAYERGNAPDGQSERGVIGEDGQRGHIANGERGEWQSGA